MYYTQGDKRERRDSDFYVGIVDILKFYAKKCLAYLFAIIIEYICKYFYHI